MHVLHPEIVGGAGAGEVAVGLAQVLGSEMMCLVQLLQGKQEQTLFKVLPRPKWLKNLLVFF